MFLYINIIKKEFINKTFLCTLQKPFIISYTLPAVKCKLQYFSFHCLLIWKDLSMMCVLSNIYNITHFCLVERRISWFLASLKVAANCEMSVVWIARHNGSFYELRNTLLTERISHLADIPLLVTAVRLVECAFFLSTILFL